MSNYAIKSEVRKAAYVDKPEFVKKTDLTSSKSDFDKLDVDKLKTVPNDLSKLSNVVETDIVKKTAYDLLVKKVSAIVSDKQNLEKSIEGVDKKIPDISNFIGTKDFNRLIKIDFNARIIGA